MDVSEIVGIIILILAFLLPAFRRRAKKKEQQRDPEEYARRQKAERAEAERVLREMFGEVPKELREEEEEEPLPPPVAPEHPHVEEPARLAAVGSGSISKVGRREFVTDLNRYEQGGGIESRTFESEVAEWEGDDLLDERFLTEGDESYGFHAEETSEVGDLIREPGNLRSMILLSEVLAPPVAFRRDEY